MERVQWFELEDLPWVPRFIRDGGTDLLDLGFSVFGFYRPVAHALVSLLDATGSSHIVDLCSGGGGGALAMRKELLSRGVSGLQWSLSDRYPNLAAIERVRALADPSVHYIDEPVDALEPRPALRGVRTMFGALHHFEPEQVRELVAANVAARAPIAFFDVAASPALRKMPSLVAPIALTMNMSMLFTASLALVPFVRPFRLSRLAATYLVPLVPALVAWDGTVSALRAYTPDELLGFARSVPGGDGYRWAADRAGPALYLTGIPS
ncbi:MAG: class I SAM-dependent methyltransferase [Polyangiaceae bacterium]|nr:class I SAM-dependent methyltransferase [Polyangiaceae bacterium]